MRFTGRKGGLPDELCPECHGRAALLVKRKDRLVKQCQECAHVWAEELPPPPAVEIVRGGWVRFNDDNDN